MPNPPTTHAEELLIALEQSVKLQSHYASLLNLHDGGRRVGFQDAQAWIDRLRETGTLPAAAAGPDALEVLLAACRQALHAVRPMAEQIICPSDNTLSRLVAVLEDALAKADPHQPPF